LGGSRISLAPLGFCGQKPRLAPAWAGWLPANFIAYAAQLGAAAGWGAAAAPASSPTRYYRKQRFIKVRPLCRIRHASVALAHPIG